MKPILVLLVFFFPFAVCAQQIEPGVWVNATLLDGNGGSRPAPSDNIEQFARYRFSEDGVLIISSDLLFKQIETKYHLENGMLTLGFVKYKVEKLTRDSLLISEIKKTGNGITYCYKRAGADATVPKPEYNQIILDSVYASNRYFFPECISKPSEFFDADEEFRFQDGLELSFIIDKTGMLVDLKIIAGPYFDKTFVTKVTKAFSSKNLKWLPATVNGQNVNTSIRCLLGRFNGKFDNVKSAVELRGMHVIYLL